MNNEMGKQLTEKAKEVGAADNRFLHKEDSVSLHYDSLRQALLIEGRYKHVCAFRDKVLVSNTTQRGAHVAFFLINLDNFKRILVLKNLLVSRLTTTTTKNILKMRLCQMFIEK